MMAWVLRILKVGALGGLLLVFGWIAAVLIGAAVLLWLLLSAESAFWGGALD